MVNQRLQQGQAIAQSYEIRKTSENTWLVPSQSGNGVYEVTSLERLMLVPVKTLNIILTW
jgi:hypothetical protein